MACTWLIVEQVTIESIGDPPHIVVARLEVVMELNRCGIHHTLHLHSVRRPLPERHRETDDEGKIEYEMSHSVVVVVVVVVVVAFQEL